MKAIKWVLLGIAGVIVLLVAALLVIPFLINVEKYKPQIESRISERLGLPVSIGGHLRLSLFPWAGIALSDLRVGNPPGFKEKTLLFVKSFEMQVRLIPLLSRDIQVKGFIVQGPRMVLEKTLDGKVNWEHIGGESPSKEKSANEESGPGDITIKSLAVGLISVRNGSLLWVDGSTGERKEIMDVDLEVKDASLDRPIPFALKASLEGQPVQVEGRVGPLGHEPMKGTLPLVVSLKAFRELAVNLTGKVQDIGSGPKFDLALDTPSFSPRKVVRSLGKDFPVTTADPNTFGQVALKCNIKGGPGNILINDAAMSLDDSKITFSANIRDPAKPDLVFKMDIDHIDLDRYLPPKAEKKGAGERSGKPPEEGKGPDYSSMRKAVLDGEIRAGNVKIMGAVVRNAFVKVRGKDGLFQLDPFGFSAYEGTVASKAEVDVRMQDPKTRIELEISGLKARPLLNEMFKKDFLEGTARAKLALRMEGDEPNRIKKTLNGSGDLRFTDGAIIGIDLAGMVRNLKSAFGLAAKSDERPKTDFSELTFPFSIKDGVLQTPGASLASPLLRVNAEGTADLNKETLDLRVEPKAVATLKGQGDTQERSGLAVPVLVTGTFAEPRFAPDLKGIFEKGLKEKLPSREELEGMIKGGDSKQEGAPSPRERLKDILKGFGR